METKGDRARLQVWLPVELLDRIVIAAQEADRPVSREIARRLEASFGERSVKSGYAEVRREDLLGIPREPAKPRVPPETPEPRAAVVERLQQQVPGVSTASTAFPSVPQDLARQVTPRPRRSG